MKSGLAAFAALVFATSAAAATAETPAAENPFAKDQVILDLKGLDLSSAEGQQRLAIRLDQAANAVCGDRVASVHLALEAQAQECRAAVVADVRSQIETRLAANSGSSTVRIALAR